MSAKHHLSVFRELLARERAAIVALDAAALEAVTEDKRHLVEAMQAEAQQANQPRTRTREVFELYAEAEANRILLAEVSGAVSELLGIDRCNVYDAHARLRTSARSLTS